MSFKGKKNIYTCEVCGHHIVTVDKDEGVTPFMISCVSSRCSGMMQSSVYRVNQNMRPSYEWFTPESTIGLAPGLLDHVQRGGLLIRAIPKTRGV